MIADPTITTSSKAKTSQPTDHPSLSSSSSSSSSSSPMLQNNTSTSYSNNNTTTDQQQMQNTPDRNSPSDNQSIQTSYSNNNNNNNNNTPIYNKTINIKSRNNNINTNEKEIQSKGDLFTDACRNGEDIIAYSINQARMNILWNKYSYHNYNIIYLQDKCISY